MEKKDIREIEKNLSEIKTFTIAQAQLIKEMLLEIKKLRRDINGHFRRNKSRECPEGNPK